MADLPAVRDDEVGKLEEAFNIVKAKLLEANKLKAQYDEAIERINTEMCIRDRGNPDNVH